MSGTPAPLGRLCLLADEQGLAPGFVLEELIRRVRRYVDAIAGRRDLPYGWCYLDAEDSAVPDELWAEPISDPMPDPPACAVDPFAIAGLRRLGRDSPDSWRGLLRSQLPVEVAKDGDRGRGEAATLRQLLLGYSRELLPPSDSAATLEVVRRARLVLGAVVEHFGDMPARSIDEDQLKRIRRVCKERKRQGGRKPLSGENASRAMTLIVRALHAWRVEQGLPMLEPHPDDAPAPPRGPRVTTRLRRVWKLLRVVDRYARLKIALAVGLGLREPEVEALDVDDFRLVMMPQEISTRWKLPAVQLLYVRVRDRRDPGRARWIPAPLWFAKLAADVLGRRGPGEPLFPEGTASLTSILRRLRRKYPSAARVTPSSLRATWMAIARLGGCWREVVRGTWRLADGDGGWEWHPAQRQLVLMAVDWGRFGSGVPGMLLDKLTTVPRRAPKGCDPRDPELKPRRRKAPDPMPAGIEKPPPPPKSARTTRRRVPRKRNSTAADDDDR